MTEDTCFYSRAAACLTLLWIILVVVVVQTFAFLTFKHLLLVFCNLDGHNISIFSKIEKIQIFRKKFKFSEKNSNFQKKFKFSEKNSSFQKNSNLSKNSNFQKIQIEKKIEKLALRGCRC